MSYSQAAAAATKLLSSCANVVLCDSQWLLSLSAISTSLLTSIAEHILVVLIIL